MLRVLRSLAVPSFPGVVRGDGAHRTLLAVVPLLALSFALLFAQGAAARAAGFTENRGQANPEVLYYSNGPGAAVFFTRDALVFDLRQAAGRESDRGRGGFHRNDLTGNQAPRPGCALWVRFAGTPGPARVEARGELPGRCSFFLGNDPARWRSEVPSYGEVIYRDLWPGVDVVFRIQDGALAYAATASREGSRPEVAFRIEGAERILPQAGGEIWLETVAGRLVNAPGAPGTGRFFRAGATSDGRSEESEHPLTLLWSTFLGGASDEICWTVALDASGNPILAGYTESFDFPTTPGAHDVSYNGGHFYGDIFVTKLSGTGSDLLWSTFLGGSEDDDAYGLALDPSGNPVLTGVTMSPNFPATPGAYDTSHNGDRDAFVAKLSSTGSELLWSTYLGGTTIDIAYGLALDPSDNPVLTGYTWSDDMPATEGAYDTSYNGGSRGDAFVAMLSSSGSDLLWGTFLGGSAGDHGTALALDSEGNPVLTGFTASSDFPTTPGAHDRSYGGGGIEQVGDAFVAKLSHTGSDLLWSTFLGADADDIGNAIDLDPSGNPVLTGVTESFDFPTTPGAFDPVQNGYDDAFVSKLSSTGSDLLWSTFLGGGSLEEGFDVAVDPSGIAVVTGYTWSSEFPTTLGAYDRTYNGNRDVFVTRVSPSGSTLAGSTFLGGTGDENGHALALDASGRAVIAGSTWSHDFPITPGAYDPAHGDGYDLDVFVAKLATEGTSEVPGTALRGSAALLPAAPNPMRGKTVVRYALTQATEVELCVFDVAGGLVRTLVSGRTPAGLHDVAWDGLDQRLHPAGTGIYVVRLRAGGINVERKITLLR